MKRNLLAIILTGFSLSLNAQLLDSIYAHQKKGISYNHQSLNRFYHDPDFFGPNIPKDRWSGGHIIWGIVYNGFYFNYRHNSTKKKGGYFTYNNLRYGDLLTSQYHSQLNVDWKLGKSITRDIISTGYIGELCYGRNIRINNEKSFVLSGGGYFSDLILPQDYFGIGGYHIVGGLFLNMDMVIGKNLVWRVSPVYARGFLWFEGSLKEYVNPRVFKIETEIIHENGWYAGFEHRETDGESERESLKIGYRFNKIGRK